MYLKSKSTASFLHYCEHYFNVAAGQGGAYYLGRLKISHQGSINFYLILTIIIIIIIYLLIMHNMHLNLQNK